METIKELTETIRNIAMTRMQTNSGNCLTNNYNCPLCKDTGWRIIPDKGQGTMKECECGTAQRLIREMKFSFANIPESFKGMTLSNFYVNIYRDDKSRKKAQSAIKAIQYWLDSYEHMKSKGMGLYLYSASTSSGKTRMAVSIANDLICNKQTQVKFATSLQILNEIKGSWNKEEYSESQLLKDLSLTEVLIIDDFGIENGNKEWINERFYHIINSRYIDKKITIFTSNLRINQLKYDDRITERIKERTFQIPFPEESVRDLIAQRNLSELINGIKNQ